MKQKGRFQLFDFPEFAQWLDGLHVSREITRIQNHHTWQPDYKAFHKLPDHLYWMESMEQFQKLNGFAEIAQQLTTFPDGKIVVGRSFDTIPAGIKGANLSAICIEHLGNFDIGGDVMTDEHREVIIKLNGELCKKFSLEPDTNTIVYHHWYDIVTGQRTNGTGTVKSCPGSNFFGGNSMETCEGELIKLVRKAALVLSDMGKVLSSDCHAGQAVVMRKSRKLF